MLNILKKFALEHFSPVEFVDTEILTANNMHCLSVGKRKVIPFVFNEKNNIYLSTKGDFLVELKEAYTDLEEIKMELSSFAPHISSDDVIEVQEYMLIPIKEEEITYDLDDLISVFKSRVNSEIDCQELNIKRLKKGYSFLRNLEQYK